MWLRKAGEYSNQDFFRGPGVEVVPAGGLRHKDGACELPGTCKGLFALITQALNLDGTRPEQRKVTQATIPDLVVDLGALLKCVQDTAMGT